MSGLDPVPRPPVEPSGAGRAVPEPKRPKWLVPVIAGGTAVVVLAAGGIGGYLYWNHNRLTEASGECATSYGKAVKARKKLTEYLESDALKAAISVKGSEVRDAETVAVLASTVKTAEQAKTDIPGCPSGNLKGIRAAAARLDRAAAAYAKTMDEVRGKADAVNASKLDKTVADATKILNDSKGRVEDDKVRAALEHAIRSRDGKAISDAVKAVNDSIKAKSDAGREGRGRKGGAGGREHGPGAGQRLPLHGRYDRRPHRIHGRRLHAIPGRRLHVHPTAARRQRRRVHSRTAAGATTDPATPTRQQRGRFRRR